VFTSTPFAFYIHLEHRVLGAGLGHRRHLVLRRGGPPGRGTHAEGDDGNATQSNNTHGEILPGGTIVPRAAPRKEQKRGQKTR
jgi:hypothetical protein